MVLVSYSGREINAKLVYYGPGLSGKTTNLEYIYGSIPQTQRGKMVSMKTKTERTLFFDFLPVNLGELAGFKTRFLLYTVPGQVYYNATRKLVLKGVDAVVFVADSKRGKMDENVESLANLRENLRENGLDLDQIPWVIQYNKRDLPEVYSVADLEQVLNPGRVPSFEAVATTGQGVVETFKAISRLLLRKLAREIGVQVVAPQADTAPAPAPEPFTPPVSIATLDSVSQHVASIPVAPMPAAPLPVAPVMPQMAAPVMPRMAAPVMPQMATPVPPMAVATPVQEPAAAQVEAAPEPMMTSELEASAATDPAPVLLFGASMNEEPAPLPVQEAEEAQAASPARPLSVGERLRRWLSGSSAGAEQESWTEPAATSEQPTWGTAAARTGTEVPPTDSTLDLYPAQETAPEPIPEPAATAETIAVTEAPEVVEAAEVAAAPVTPMAAEAAEVLATPDAVPVVQPAVAVQSAPEPEPVVPVELTTASLPEPVLPVEPATAAEPAPRPQVSVVAEESPSFRRQTRASGRQALRGRPREILVPLSLEPGDLVTGVVLRLAFQMPQMEEDDSEMDAAA